MNQPSIGPPPYAKLGQKLRNYRKSHRESLAEVSGAVEIDEHILERYEAGIDRPDEEILNLLINHYRLEDIRAGELWELAGYSIEHINDQVVMDEIMTAAKQVIMVFASDGRAPYTDGIHIDCNKQGMHMSFTQSTPNNKAVTVARLGMSYEQAEEISKAIGVALNYAKFSSSRQLLPPGSQKQ